jgi:hypothetical protein
MVAAVGVGWALTRPLSLTLTATDDGKLLVFSDFLDNRLRVYEIPPYKEFANGGGGRFEARLAEIRK